MKNLIKDLFNLLQGILCNYSKNPKDHDWESVTDYYEADGLNGGTATMDRVCLKCKRCGRLEDDFIDW